VRIKIGRVICFLGEHEGTACSTVFLRSWSKKAVILLSGRLTTVPEWM